MFRVSEYLYFAKRREEDEYRPRPCAESRRFGARRTGKGREDHLRASRRIPWGSKRERLAPLPAFEGPRHAAAMRVVPQRFAPLSLTGDKGAFCFANFGKGARLSTNLF